MTSKQACERKLQQRTTEMESGMRKFGDEVHSPGYLDYTWKRVFSF